MCSFEDGNAGGGEAVGVGVGVVPLDLLVNLVFSRCEQDGDIRSPLGLIPLDLKLLYDSVCVLTGFYVLRDQWTSRNSRPHFKVVWRAIVSRTCLLLSSTTVGDD